ncbi:hypothetical protein [Anabaena azotica]|uniref:Uncharacterized protein n=1 Tax=Anabaena azotica FACHB-119 TaxID=947527 RepID=A0ABR8DF14_9NOST|nr:hypothetical protein [Anabaena azotica]MBD2505689.1 hypothetical protein [Anabaena azotica FACHB-119]
MSTQKEILSNIAQCCEYVGLELLDDGIYYGDRRMVEFVESDSQTYYVQTLQEQPLDECKYADLLDIPIGQLTPEQREMLFGGGEELAA